MSRRYLVKSAADYAACVKHLTTIKILYVPNMEIERRRTELDAIWGSAIAFPGTHRVHCVRTVDPGIVTLSNYSVQPSPELHVLVQQVSSVTGISEDQPASVKPGSYVTIPIPTERGRSILYVAAVCSTTTNKMKIRYLQSTGSFGIYRDPDDADSSSEDIKNALFVCPEPQISTFGTARLRYSFKFSDQQRAMMQKYAMK